MGISFESANKCKHVHKVVRSQNKKGSLKRPPVNPYPKMMFAYHANISARELQLQYSLFSREPQRKLFFAPIYQVFIHYPACIDVFTPLGR